MERRINKTRETSLVQQMRGRLLKHMLTGMSREDISSITLGEEEVATMITITNGEAGTSSITLNVETIGSTTTKLTPQLGLLLTRKISTFKPRKKIKPEKEENSSIK